MKIIFLCKKMSIFVENMMESIRQDILNLENYSQLRKLKSVRDKNAAKKEHGDFIQVQKSKFNSQKKQSLKKNSFCQKFPKPENFVLDHVLRYEFWGYIGL